MTPEQLNTEVQKDVALQNTIYENNIVFIERLCRKYFDMGRRSTATPSEQTLMALQEMKALYDSTRDQQLAVERDVENAGIEALKVKYSGEFGAQVVQEFVDLTNQVDSLNGKLIAERNKAVNELIARFQPPVVEG